MAHLKSLNFTTVPKAQAANPVLVRRSKLIVQLENQKALAKDPTFAPTVTRTVKDTEGNRQRVQVQKPLRPNRRTDANGAIVLTVRYGFKTLEFEKGKAGIAVPSKEKLVGVIDTLIAAVRSGELDSILERHGKPRHEKTRAA